MNYQDEFRQKDLVLGLAERLRKLVSGCGRTMSFLEVCGTHTMAIHRMKMRKVPGTTHKLYEQILEEEEVYEQTRINEEKKRKEIELFINRFR